MICKILLFEFCFILTWDAGIQNVSHQSISNRYPDSTKFGKDAVNINPMVIYNFDTLDLALSPRPQEYIVCETSPKRSNYNQLVLMLVLGKTDN